MNEPFFPLPVPRDPENGLAAVLSRFFRRHSGRRSRARRAAPTTRPGVRPPFPILPPPVL